MDKYDIYNVLYFFNSQFDLNITGKQIAEANTLTNLFEFGQENSESTSLNDLSKSAQFATTCE